MLVLRTLPSGAEFDSGIAFYSIIYPFTDPALVDDPQHPQTPTTTNAGHITPRDREIDARP